MAGKGSSSATPRTWRFPQSFSPGARDRGARERGGVGGGGTHHPGDTNHFLTVKMNFAASVVLEGKPDIWELGSAAGDGLESAR